MNRETLVKHLTELTILFPSRKLSEGLINAYYIQLKFVPEIKVEKIFELVVSKARFFPTVSDILDASNAIIENHPQPQNYTTRCSSCDGNGLVWMQNQTSSEHKYFLCPKNCQKAQGFANQYKPIPKQGWLSKAHLARTWFNENPHNPFVHIVKKALENYKKFDDEKAIALNQPIVDHFASSLGIDRKKAWAYPTKKESFEIEY